MLRYVGWREFQPGALLPFTGKGSEDEGNGDERQQWQIASNGMICLELVERVYEDDKYSKGAKGY